MASQKLKTLFENVKNRLGELRPEDIVKFAAEEAVGAIPVFGQVIKDAINEFSPDETKELLKELNDLSERQFAELSEKLGVSVEYLINIRKITLHTCEILHADHEEIKGILLHLIEIQLQAHQTPFLDCSPESPPDVSIFVDRETNLEDLRISLAKKSMIVIQGIPGIGKSNLAARLKENLKDHYTTFWYRLSRSDKFLSVARCLAGFLKKNGDPALADYVRNVATKYEDVVELLLRGLQNKNYVLFFDDYHRVKNEEEELHNLFSDLKDRLKGSTIVITTREPLPFVSVIADNEKVTEENIEPFEYDITRKYLERMGVEIKNEQLIELDKRLGGTPLYINFFANLAKEKGVGKALDDIPEKKEIKKHLLHEIYQQLDEKERRVMKALSVFRTPVTPDACVSVASGENVKETLISLKEKQLVSQKGCLYDIHDLLKKFFYEMIDDPKEYHCRASEYYAQLEKRPENIQETTYHMIKDTGSITDEVVKYLKGTPKDLDPFTCVSVLDLLTTYEITSLNIFELLDEFTSAPDSNVQKVFINEYGNFFEKIWTLNHEKSIEVLRQILDHADSSLLRLVSRAVAGMAFESPDEACELWKEIIDKGDMIVLEYVFYHITKDTKLGKKAGPVLKYLIERREISPRASLLAKRELERFGILKAKNYMTCEEHLEKIRTISTNEDKLSYVISDVLDDVTISWYFVIEILNNIYKTSPEKVAGVLKLLINPLPNSSSNLDF